MADQPIKFSDGAAYERFMGIWSRMAGDAFLDWLAPAPALRWLDVGCGNGAFTEILARRCAPKALHGIDPSEAQLGFARGLPALRDAVLQKGDAMALPFSQGAFDAAVMPLVIFFVPEPAKGVAEMARVVAPGGLVTAYSWDMPGEGFPYALLQKEMLDMGLAVPKPPHPEASSMEALRDLWAGAGLEAVETRAITVGRSFDGLEDFWTTVLGAPSMGPTLAALTPDQVAGLKARLKTSLPFDSQGRINLGARANAIRGRVK